MNDQLQPTYDIDVGAVDLMLVVTVVLYAILLAAMLAAWRGWWPFNRQDK